MVDDLSSRRTFDVTELAKRAGVTPRTIHYYIQQGLLPPAASTGPGPKYGEGHLARVRLIKRLQRNHLPLAEIAKRLKRLTDENVREALDEGASAGPKPASALDYVRSVLKESGPPAAGGPHRHVMASRSPGIARLALTAAAPATPQVRGDRSQWERFTLADGFELHVRRPMDRMQQKALERLLKSAKQILEEEQS